MRRPKSKHFAWTVAESVYLHEFMLRKFFAVVECDGVAFILVGAQQARRHSRDTSGMLVAYVPRQHITRHTVSQRDQTRPCGSCR
nr:hypothetical protein [Rugosibacter aromaticivorans]